MPSTRRTSKRRLIRPASVFGVLVLLVIGLALLAIPFLKAPGHAQGAKTDLQAAKDSLTAGDFASAETSVQSARRHADEVQGAMQGFGGDVWRFVPVLGGSVSDVRHLGNALDDLTSVAETAVDAWPQINGDRATLFGDGKVDLPTLASLTASLDEVSKDLGTAEEELEAVGDERPFAGQQLASVRDDALDLVAPLGDGVDALSPVMDVLPGMLGSNNERKYLIAVLNPSELRYSGGAVLALSELTTQDGRFEVGGTFDTSESRAFFRPFYWLKVKGNPFHRGGQQSAQTATYAPNWPVSGNELLNAFRSLRNRPGAGVIAVDSVALARMLEFTGPITVPGYPTLTPDNFLFETIGNYDAYPDPDVRKRLNAALAPAFTDALLDPRDVVDKLTAVHELAQARHFAVYFREPEPQAAFADLGLAGDLSDTEHDYIAVFNQNTNISKADYWQRRAVSSEVDLKADGSATVRLSMSVHNDSPPGAGLYNQRGQSYTTRWNGMSLAAFLPMGAEVTSARVNGKVVPFTRRQYFGRPFVRRTITFPPQSRKTYEIEYDVPAAATVDDDGTVSYRLDLTPQGMVTPQAVSVRVKFPKGLEVSAVPEGWGARGGRVATYENPGLITQPTFTVTASPATDDAP